jgi:hypothetical protein
MKLSQRILRAIAPKDEELRQEFRKAIACSEAHAEDLMRTMRAIPSEAIQEMLRHVKAEKK